MVATLHRAIRDGVRDGAFEKNAILVDLALRATRDVAGRDEELYEAVHALFVALPDRLVRGSLFLVATSDVDDGVELSWDSREEVRAAFVAGQGLLAPYDVNEPVAIALSGLMRYCDHRAGFVRTSFENLSNSSSFPRRSYLHRRVIARLPLDPAAERARAELASAPAEPPRVTVARPPSAEDSGPRFSRHALRRVVGAEAPRT